ncbi:MAG: hypothetical protein HPM95_07665 [Alphaproteobacteria bacterium]|nr:hypothetical protein [Alphaproteobacteria bacterium]
MQQDRVASLTATLEQFKGASRSNEDQIRLRELEREAQVKATQLDQLMTRYREADTRRNAPQLGADARVISRATVPLRALFAEGGADCLDPDLRRVPAGEPLGDPRPVPLRPGFPSCAAWRVGHTEFHADAVVRSTWLPHRSGRLYASSGFGYDWPSNGRAARPAPGLPGTGAAPSGTRTSLRSWRHRMAISLPRPHPLRLPRPRSTGCVRAGCRLERGQREVAQEVTFRLVREAAEEGSCRSSSRCARTLAIPRPFRGSPNCWKAPRPSPASSTATPPRAPM